MDYLVKVESASLDSFGRENKSDGSGWSAPLAWSYRTAEAMPGPHSMCLAVHRTRGTPKHYWDCRGNVSCVFVLLLFGTVIRESDRIGLLRLVLAIMARQELLMVHHG